jgi:DNA (cytosine-5)-methyltransferase 1
MKDMIDCCPIHTGFRHRKDKRLTAIDVFSGCGGLTLGLKQAGFEVIGALDNDPLAVETYCANHKNVIVWETDIRNFSVYQVKRQLKLQKGDLDLLAGCPPCQGFSTIRTLNRAHIVKDPRNDLVFDFLRFVEELAPKAVMMENVPGLVTDKRLTVFCQRLSDLGYTSEYRILNAADYGVPQRRRRVILLGGRFGPIQFTPPDLNRRTVRDAIAFLPDPGLSGDPLHNLSEKRSPRIVDIIKRIPKNGGSRTDLGSTYQLACHKKCNGFKDIYGRMAWDDVAPTITSGCVNPSKGRFIHPEQDRAITLREAALLQTFPPDYFFSLRRGKFSAASLIGNALPPEFIRHNAAKIRKYLKSI